MFRRHLCKGAGKLNYLSFDRFEIFETVDIVNDFQAKTEFINSLTNVICHYETHVISFWIWPLLGNMGDIASRDNSLVVHS